MLLRDIVLTLMSYNHDAANLIVWWGRPCQESQSTDLSHDEVDVTSTIISAAIDMSARTL